MRSEFTHEHAFVLAVSVLVHAVLLALLALNLELMPRRAAQPVRLAIQGTVVDSRTLERLAERERERQAEARRVEERRLEEQRRQREELRLSEQRRRDQAELARKEEQRRKQEAEKMRLAKVEQERQEVERQKREAAEARRKAESQRRQAQAKADLARQMAEEEELQAAADSGLLDQYAEVIRQKVERNWIRPASARAGLHCVVLVKQIPGGDVVDVRVAECNGDAAVVRSIEVAVFRSSPLPPPPNPSLFDRSLRFEFKPEE